MCVCVYIHIILYASSRTLVYIKLVGSSSHGRWLHTMFCIMVSYSSKSIHDDVIKWKHFPRNWPFVRGIHRSGDFPTQRPVTCSFDVFFDLRLNKRLSKQPWGWWFETPSWSLWRQCNAKREVDRLCHLRQSQYFCVTGDNDNILTVKFVWYLVAFWMINVSEIIVG